VFELQAVLVFNMLVSGRSIFIRTRFTAKLYFIIFTNKDSFI